MTAIYQNQEWDVIGQNYCNYMIIRYDTNKDDYIMRVVPKKEVEVKE